MNFIQKVEQLDPRVETLPVETGANFRKQLNQMGLLGDDLKSRLSPFVVRVGDKYLLEEEWPEAMPDEPVLIEKLAAGGGGGGGGSKPLGIIMAAFAIVAAPFTAGQSLLLLIPAAGLLMTGSVPVPKAMSPSLTGTDTVSSTYSVSTNLNSARLYSAIPRLYGRLKITPDLASQPYTEFEGNEQYLYQLLTISVGRAAVKQVYIGNTPLDNFDGVQTQVINPYEKVTLFPDNVVTSSAVDNILIPNNGSLLGPFVSTPVGSGDTRELAVDIHFPGGCYKINQETGKPGSSSVRIYVVVTPVDDNGDVIGDPIQLGNKLFSFSTQTSQRATLRGEVPPGRYSVSVSRSGESKENDSKVQNDCYWVGLKSYLEPVGDYGNVTLLAIKVKASESLNSSTSREFSVIAAGMVRTWHPVLGWSEDPVETRSIAWAAADILTDTSYGAGLGDTKLDLTHLYQLDQVWSARGDECNYYFDNTTSVWDALSRVLRAGRAAPMYYAGKVEFIRDSEKLIPNIMFNPEDLVKNSLRVTYEWPMDDSPDHVVVQYYDRDTWTQEEVICALPGSPLRVPAKVEMLQISNRNQAWREGITMAASNRYRRRKIQFSTVHKGKIPRYNDLVSISHDLAAWGYPGVVISLDRVTGKIRTSEPLPFVSGDMVISFQKKDGSPDGPYSVVADPTLGENEFGGIVEGDLTDVWISDGIKTRRTPYQFGPSGRTSLLGLALKATPKGSDRFDFEMVNYAPEVPLAESGQPVPPTPPSSGLITPPTGPVIDRVIVVDTAIIGQQTVSWTPAVGARYYQVQTRQANGEWADEVSSVVVTSIPLQLPPGPNSVRVRGVSDIAGHWVYWTGTLIGTTYGLPELSSFVSKPDLFNINLTWEFTEETRLTAEFTEIYGSETPIPAPGAIQLIGQFPFPTNSYTYVVGVPARTGYFWARVKDRAGRYGPFFQNGTPVSGTTSDDPEAMLQYLTGQIGASQLTSELQTQLANLGEAATEISENITELNGVLSATVTMRAQVNSGGKLVTAGIGLGVVPDPEDPSQYNSEIIFLANRVAFIADTEPGAEIISPFVIDAPNRLVYMHGAFIQDLTVGTAKIAQLAVETVKIGDEAVTIPRFMQREEGNIPGGLLVGFSVDVPDYYGGLATPFMLLLNHPLGGSISSNTTWSFSTVVQVDGVTVANPRGNGQGGFPYPNPVMIMVELSPGTHTITASGTLSGPLYYSNPSMLLLGVKR